LKHKTKYVNRRSDSDNNRNAVIDAVVDILSIDIDMYTSKRWKDTYMRYVNCASTATIIVEM